MEVYFSRELELFVSTKMRSGRYSCATEVVTEALRLLEERDTLLGKFNRELGHRLETLDQGIHASPSDARDRLARKSEERRRASLWSAMY